MSFTKDLEEVLAKHCKSQETGTPDYVLAMYLVACFKAFDSAQLAKHRWEQYRDPSGNRKEVNTT